MILESAPDAASADCLGNSKVKLNASTLDVFQIEDSQKPNSRILIFNPEGARLISWPQLNKPPRFFQSKLCASVERPAIPREKERDGTCIRGIGDLRKRKFE